MKYKFLSLVLSVIFISACNTEMAGLCDSVSVGMTEEEIINKIGEPYSKTEISNDGIIGLMYKESTFPSLVVLSLQKNSDNVLVLENCGHIE